MRLYKKLGYIGSIWILLEHSFLTIVVIVSLPMLYQLKPFLEASQPSASNLIFSLLHSSLLSGIVGIITCVIIIFSVKKIKRPDSIRKKLSIILIITGIILFVIQIIQFLIWLNFADEVITSSLTYTGGYTSILNTESILGILIGIIPSVILIISGILAVKFVETKIQQLSSYNYGNPFPNYAPKNFYSLNDNTDTYSSNKFPNISPLKSRECAKCKILVDNKTRFCPKCGNFIQ